MFQWFSTLRRTWRRFRDFSAEPPAGRGRPKLLIVVEGRHDVEFLRRISAVLHADQRSLPELAAVERRGELIFLPAGGDDFRPWMTRLAGFGCAEFHLYDRELPPVSSRREQFAAIVNQRPHCRAFVTSMRSVENYLHPAAVQEASGCQLSFSDLDDVAMLAARAKFALREGVPTWDELSPRARRRLRNRAKAWLNTDAVDRMTPERLAQRDPAGEVIAWLTAIADLLDSAT